MASTVIGYNSQAALSNAKSSGDPRLNSSNSKVIGGGQNTAAAPAYNSATGAATGQASAEYNDYLKSLNKPESPNYVSTSLNPVITSQAAQDDLAAKKEAFATMQTDNANQSAILANKKLLDDYAASQAEQAKTSQSNIQTGLDQKQQEIDAKNAALGIAPASKSSESPGSLASPDASITSAAAAGKDGTTPSASPIDAANAGISDATKTLTSGLSDIDKAKDSLAAQALTQLNSVLKGTFPLSGPQKSLIDSLNVQLQQSIASQKVANQAYTGAVTQAGFRSGGEYTPEQYAGQIANSISYGTAKIQELDNSAAKTMAELESNFQTQDYDMITKNYDIMTKQLEDKSSHLKDMFDAVTSTLKDQRDQELKAQDTAYQKEQDKIKNENDAKRLASDLATDSLQRQKLSVDISNAKQAALDAKNELPKAVAGRVAQIANQFDGEDIVKQYNTIAGQVGYVKNLGDTPTDDQARIYAFAKVMDPSSSVREGEYKTVQDYAQAVVSKYATGAKRIFDNSGLLTPEARNLIKDTLDKRASIVEKQYDNLSKEYGRRIENVGAPAGTGLNYITNYKGAFDPTSQETVDDYVSKNPDKADAIAQLYDVPNTSDDDVVEYINSFLSPQN